MPQTFLSVGTSSGSLSAVPAPTGFQWGLQDISAADSGRTNDVAATMQKNRVTQKRKLQLSWTNPSAADTATILTAFNPEYVYVRYLDAMANAYETRQFYVGDRSAPLRQVTVNGVTYTTLSFNIIER